MKKVQVGKTYVGVVEDNQDPKKEGRVRIRVMDVFDDLKLEDIPWATPWKDLNGNEFSVPDKGKVVITVFDQGDVYKPELEIVKPIIEKLMREALPLNVPVEVGIGVGLNWLEAH